MAHGEVNNGLTEPRNKGMTGVEKIKTVKQKNENAESKQSINTCHRWAENSNLLPDLE